MEIRTQGTLERLLRETHEKRPIAIVMGGSVNGLSFVRSLGRRGIPTLLLDSESLIGTYTRYGANVLLPLPEKNLHEWTELLNFVGSRLDLPGVLFPTSDSHCLLVSEQATLL